MGHHGSTINQSVRHDRLRHQRTCSIIVIEDTIRNGVPSSTYGGATAYETSQAKVIVDSITGRVITVMPR